MKYIIEDYNTFKHQEIDTWIDEKKYKNAKIINKFALFNEPISDFYHYICSNPFGMANIGSFIKVFRDKDIIVGVSVFHYYVEENIFYLRINPLFVNPKLMNRGIGKNILKDIIKSLNEINNSRVDYLTAKVEKTNLIGIKLFKSASFKITKKDDDFIEFIYKV